MKGIEQPPPTSKRDKLIGTVGFVAVGAVMAGLYWVGDKLGELTGISAPNTPVEIKQSTMPDITVKLQKFLASNNIILSLGREESPRI